MPRKKRDYTKTERVMGPPRNVYITWETVHLVFEDKDFMLDHYDLMDILSNVKEYESYRPKYAITTRVRRRVVAND
jgi:hypothetical protein